MSNGEVSRIQLNQDGTISVEVSVQGFDEGTPIEISGQAIQENGAVASFYSIQEMPPHAGEGVFLMLDSIPTVPPNSFVEGFPITIVTRVAQVWVTKLAAAGESPQQASAESSTLKGAWKSSAYGPALSLDRPPGTTSDNGPVD